MNSCIKRARWCRLALVTLAWSALGGAGAGYGRADAASVAQFAWTNTTVNTATDLRLEIDTDTAVVAADAVFRFELSELFGVPSSAAIDQAPLAATMDGTFTTTLADSAITLTRDNNGSVLPQDTTLVFVLKGLQTPLRAGVVRAGSLVVSDATQPSVFALDLPEMLVVPGMIWNARAALSSTVSGRATSLFIALEPANSIPADGSIVISLPDMYDSLPSAALESTTGVDGSVSLTTARNQMRVTRALGSGTATAISQQIELRITGIVHPLLEGPMGTNIRVDTLDGLNRLIDQVYIDISDIVLEKAQVMLSTRRLVVREGSPTTSEYTLHLTAPPVGAQVTVLVSPDTAFSAAVAVSPTQVVFSAANWSAPATVAVTLHDDSVAHGDPTAANIVEVAHSIAEAFTTEPTFAAVDTVQFLLEDNDIPLVQVSSRYAAVIEGLRNDTYAIVLTSEPRAEVRIDLVPDDAFVAAIPDFVVFSPNAWSMPQQVTLVGSVPPTVNMSTTRQSRRTRVRHFVASTDVNFDASRQGVVVPQSEVLVYYEPLELDQCVESCRPGWFAFSNASSGESLCLTCPLGFFCSGGCADPVACPAGTQSNISSATSALSCLDCPVGSYNNQAGMVTCFACPTGASCLSAAQGFEPCPAGTWSAENDHQCHDCPAGSYNNQTLQGRCVDCPEGYYCPTGSTTPVLCASGTVSVAGGSRACGPCPAGYDCSASPPLSPTQCPDGSYSLQGDSSCLPCPRGFACPQIDQPPRTCSLGTTSAVSSTSCSLCPIGYSCAVASVDPEPCALGTYSSSPGSTICRACPAGYSCADPSLSPSACAAGTYSSEGDYSCHACPAGKYCPDQSEVPKSCLSGSYSLGSATSCTLCPIGSNCTSLEKTPATCPDGQYSTDPSTPCTQCPAGFYCPSPSSNPIPCSQGSYSLEGATQCIACPYGFACASTRDTPVPCALGQVNNANFTACIQCPKGYECSPLRGFTVLCEIGTYSLDGDIACRPCPPGYQCPTTTDAPARCSVGTFATGGKTHCTSCPGGYICPQLDGSMNAPCPVGSFAPGSAISCTPCPAGHACSHAVLDAPVPCLAGSYSTSSSASCIPCPPGYACPDTTTNQRIQCPAGSYSTGGEATCTPCPAGYQCLLTNSSMFQPCSSGWYSPVGSAACIQCPRGYFCDTPGEMPKNCSVGSYSLNGSSSCIACDPGYECPRSDQLPQPCPVGYYSEGGVANCKPCRPGYKCGLASTNPTPPQDECPMGGYCNPTTTFFLCPAGTFGNVTGGESVDHACAPCPEGYYCEMGSTPLTKQVCPPGYVCPEATKRASQYPCPSGTFSALSEQKSLDVCQVCPAGSYCEQGCDDPQACPLGYFCLEGTKSASQYPCPAGTFSGPQTGLQLASQCQQCEIGSYCPEASSTPTKCPAGTYNPSVGSAGLHECLDCPPGWSCPQVGQSTFKDRCAAGHYCPSGTVVATAKPCLAGTYTESITLIRAEDCTICPLRHACPQGTGGETQTMLDCGAGFFCPNGTAFAKQFPCLPGTWSSSTSLAAASECDVCPKGNYCTGGKSFIDGSCSTGHYCPLGTASATQFPCPIGTYSSKTWLFEPSQCDDCPPGYYCPAGSVEPIACKPGSYSSRNNTEQVGPGAAWPSCVTCPAGYFCVDASVTPAPCGKGKYSGAGSKACSPCEAGYFCSSDTTSNTDMRSNVIGWASPGALYGKCYNGTYCPPGSDSEPALETDACPRGYYCPTATPQPMICPAGTYSNFTGLDALDDCVPTPAGYFSLEGALQPAGECAPGFYCPLRSSSRTQVPCPARYYLNRTRGQSEDDCALCVAGSFCPQGSAYPVPCPSGSYCRTGVAAPEPCPIGTYANASGLRQVEDCTLCSPGMYCDSTGLTVPRGPCDPGYYCTLGAYTSAPMNFESTIFGVSNRHTGAQCPQGAYCPLGSALPTLCPPGTFNNFTGLETESQCVPCPAGQYCETPGLFLPTGDCFAGYYCTGGSNVPTQFPAPPGYFSSTGATSAMPCPLGQFNLHSMQQQCIDCPAGFYCGSPATIQPVVCPTGNFCLKNTAMPAKCPPGTFSGIEGLVAEMQCEACPAGAYCDSYGLSAPSGNCFEGYVCTLSSPVANPVDEAFGFICPAGHYCPQGSGVGVQCPNGTFRASTGGTNATSCAPCPGGLYCGGTALTAPSGKCSEGYFCISRASTASPTDAVTGDVCPAGFYCAEGTVRPVRCAAGTFARDPGQSKCTPCLAGFFCDGVTTDRLFDCPVGYFCPPGTGATPASCPVGTFGNRPNAHNTSECLACTPGFYCDSAGLAAPSGSCEAGFYCPEASENKFGKNATTVTRPCPVGAYCPEKTHIPVPCPVGTYSNATGLAGANECTFCDEGSFCATLGLTIPSGPCDAGFYCKRNNTAANPAVGVTTSDANGGSSSVSFGGDLCPLGSYCTVGSVAPRSCPEGTYADEVGTAVCKACVAGHYCLLGTVNYSATRCPPGYYCPEGTKRPDEYPCPPGTFGNVTGMQNEAQCIPAPGGMYVHEYAATQPTGMCTSGFYCSGGSVSSTPLLGATGGPCLPGTNCPEGSAVPIVCNAGSFCSSTNTDKALPCDEGFYCVQGSYTANPTGQNNSLGLIGDVCSAGHYCPPGTSNPIPCPPGSFSGNTQNTNASACFPCPPGFLCRESGIAEPFEKCPPGYICTGGEREATQLCPKGFECPEGSSQAQVCSAGSFSDKEGLAQCTNCPERYFCVRGATHPQECPAGFYCPLGTSSSILYPCLPGTFSNRTSLAAAAECTLCPPGKFCSGVPPTDTPTGACAPGYFCAEGANISQPSDGTTGGRCAGGFVCVGGAQLATPIDNTTGRACDAGYYCPAGSSIQIRCPKGTYNSLEQQTTCTTCPAGKYCDTNSTAPASCPQRYYCPQGTVEPILCPSGTFGHRTSLETAEQCAACSTGKYCTGGVETASCAAGYYCKMYNDEPNPATAANASSIDFGGPCPTGHYCPEGVLDPFPCPNFKARLETHGSSVDDCGVCPAGMSCEDGAVTITCPRGSYCALGNSSVPCPIGTYNPSEGQKALEDCLPCAAGKLCNRTGVIDPSNYMCPPGHYCLLAEKTPKPCPVGTFRRAAGGRSADDCDVCVGGSFCSLGTVEPVICESTTYCPIRSGLPTPCPGGSYCPFNSTQPTTCPQGFYCPRSSELPIACSRGFYCPTGSSTQLPCPLGYIGRETPLSGTFTTLGDACESCPSGMYGADPMRIQCEVCLEGFVCLGATTSRRPMSRETENGYECPPGFYCPAGSSRERACPSGTYQPDPGASNSSFCRECPANSYQHVAGQPSCLPCSKSAFSSPGATKCTCMGSHRAFQMTDGYCICEPGYEFYDQDMILRSDEDDDVDCQPIVYDRCGSNQIRSESGSCISTQTVSCESSCNNGTGTYVSSMGLCQCDQQPDLDIVCDKKCRENSMQLQVNSTTGELQLFDPVTGQIERLQNADASQGVVSKVSCTSGSCQLHSVAIQASGFSGSYAVPSSLTGQQSSASRRRRLLSDAELAISNPMLCLSVGSGVLFDLSTPGSYPIYLKDSMLNTNPSFDYGAFRALATKVKANTSSVSAFAFSFTEAGTYVFGNSLNSAAKTVVVIMSDGTSCPTDGPIVPLNEKNLISVSAKRRTDGLILAPDWGLIVGLLGGLFGMVAAIVTGLYYFRTKSWTNSRLGKKLTGYRARSKHTDLAAVHSKGSLAASNPVTSTDGTDTSHKAAPILLDEPISPEMAKPGAGRYEADLDRWDDEDLDVRELVDRLQFHHESVAKCFEDQKGSVATMTKQLQTEATELKRLFVNALLSSRPSSTSADPTLLEHGIVNPEVTTEAADLVRLAAMDEAKALKRNSFLLDHLERELVDRHRYEKRKSGALHDVIELLGEVENWQLALPELATALADEMALNVDTLADQPEKTRAARPDSHLEKVQSVLSDLQSVLCSDPSTRTPSSLVQIVDSERARREIEAFVLDESQRHLHALRPEGETRSDAVNEDMLQLLNLHDTVSKTHNRADEMAQAQVAALHKFGLVVPKVAQALSELERDFKTELSKLKEEQNPSKERALKLQLESKLGKLLSDLAKGAGKINVSVQKEISKVPKCEQACHDAETRFVSALDVAKKKQDILHEGERHEVLAEARAHRAAQSAQQQQHEQDQDTLNNTRDKTLLQIKDLLIALTTELSARQQVGREGVGAGLAPALSVTPLDNAMFGRIRANDPLIAVGAKPDEMRSATDSQVAEMERTVHFAALELANAQATMREQYRQKLETEFPQLQSDERDRLLDEFASDLHQMTSSASVDALKGQEDLRGVLAARKLVQETQQQAVQAAAARHEEAILQDRREHEEQLTTQFEQEELAIEQEYLQELSQLEQEFEMIGDDFAEAPSFDDEDDAGDDSEGNDDDGSNIDDGSDGDASAKDEIERAVVHDATEHNLDATMVACRECEDELLRVRAERERALAELESALTIERQRQRDKLAERLKKQRAEVQGSDGIDRAERAESVERELERNETAESERLEQVMSQQAARAVSEEQERFDLQEAELEVKRDQLLREAASIRANSIAAAAAPAQSSSRQHSNSSSYSTSANLLTAQTTSTARQQLRNTIAARIQHLRRDAAPLKHIPTNATILENELDSILSTIQRVHDAHDHTRKQLQERLDDEARLRKAQLADRLQRRRAELQSRVATGEVSPNEHAREVEALVQEEQEQRAHLQAETESRVAQLRDAAQRRTQSSTEALVAALADDTIEVDRLIDECRQKHARDEQALREQLALDRQRQQQSLHERLAKRREQLRSSMEVSGASAEDVARAERELDNTDAQEQRELEASLRASEQSAWVEREQLHGREVLALTSTLAQDAQRDEARAKREEQAALDELTRVRREHEAHSEALRAAMEVERQRKNLELAERLRKRRDQRLQEVRALGASDAEALERVEAEERLEQLVLEGELSTRGGASVLSELERQRIVEQELGDALDDATLRAAQAEAARKAIERAHALEAERVQNAYRQQHGELADDDALRRRQQKRVLQDRLAARRAGKPESGSGPDPAAQHGSAKSMRDVSKASLSLTIVGDDSMDREIQRVKDAHDVGWQAQVNQLELEAALKKARLADRIAKKRAALAVATLGDAPANAQIAIEREETEAFEAIESELDEAKKQLQSAMEAEERALHTSVNAAAKAKADELERLLAECKRAHADETANLRNQQALERQQREQSLQDRLSKRRAQKFVSHISTDGADAPDVLKQDELDRREREQLAKTREVDEAAALAALEERQRAEVAAVMLRLDEEAERKRAAALEQQQNAEQQLERLQVEHRESLQGLNDSLAAQRAQQESKLQQRLLSRRAKKQEELGHVHANEREVERALRELDHEQAAQRLQFDQAWENEIVRKLEKETEQQRQRELEVAHLVRQAALDAAAADAARKAVEVASRVEMNRVAAEFLAETSAAVAQQSAEAESHRQRLQDRLAEKKQKRANQKLKRVLTLANKSMKRVTDATNSATDVSRDDEARLQREQEVQTLAQQAEAAALKKQADAQELQQQTQRELERLKEEHENEMKSLNASLLADQKRQEQKLQERIAQRRERKQKEAAASANDKERERLAAQLEEDERKEKLALEAEIAVTAARKIQEELERQRQKEAELAARIDQAAVEAAAAEATRKAVEAARELEIERLSKEFDEKSRELRQSNQADLAAQKKKLEARIAAKRQKKLLELEAKKELELQKLKQQEANAIGALEADRAKVESVLETFAAAGDSGEESRPLDTANVDNESASASRLIPAAASDADTVPQPQAAELRQPASAAHLAVQAQQQAKDIAAIEQLFALGLIPQQMSLMAGIELVVSQRHQLETAALLASQHNETVAATRQGIGALMQRKASAKAHTLSDASCELQQRETRLLDIDRDFDAQIRALEQQLHADAEHSRLAHTTALKHAQLTQIEFLLTHFAPHHAVAVARLHAQQTNDATSDERPRVRRADTQSSRVLLQSDAESDDLDLVKELRARLEVEKHERMKVLLREKDAELHNSRTELESDLAALAARFEQLVANEVAEIERTFRARLEQLSPSRSGAATVGTQQSKFRAEKDAQVAQLVLMLRGRQAKQGGRLRRLAAKRAELIEDEFARKADVLTAAMLQRVVEEKETLALKQKLLRGNEVDAQKPAHGDRRDALPRESVIAREVEARLVRIEEMLHNKLLQANKPSTTDDASDSADTARVSQAAADSLAAVASYRAEMKDAVAHGCHHAALLMPANTDLSADRLAALHAGALPASDMNASMRMRFDFLKLVLQLATPATSAATPTTDPRGPSLSVVAVRSLVESDAKDTLSPVAVVDTAKQTLFLHAACLLDLSTGQLAILGLHALAQMHTQCTDVSDPTFVTKMYELLLQCYQSLFHSQQAQQSIAGSSSDPFAAADLQSSPTPQLFESSTSSSRWQSRLQEMEAFLSTLERSETLSPSLSGTGLPSSDGGNSDGAAKIERHVSVRSLGASARSSSQTLLGRRSPNDVDLYVLQERKQLVQEKLDAAEKLYTQVLRQYQEQKESLEYLREMLTEEQEQEQGDKGSEGVVSMSSQTQHEVAALEAALVHTRKERDELFAQCQALRDDLRRQETSQ